MRLFLFSASVFYLLGLKLISKVEIQPFFHQKSVSTEATVLPSKKAVKPMMSETDVQVKKDTLTLQKIQSEKHTEPASEKIKK